MRKVYKVAFSRKFKNGIKVNLFTYTFGENAENIIGQLNDISVGLAIENKKADKKWRWKVELPAPFFLINCNLIIVVLRHSR